jgi:two-component system, LytTR family, sensor kinase
MTITREKVSRFLISCLGLERPKSKQLLILVISFHVTAWILFFSLPLFLYPIEFRNSALMYSEFGLNCSLVALFYLNYYFLIPKFFNRKKVVKYLLLLAVAVLIIILFHFISGYRLFTQVINSQETLNVITLSNTMHVPSEADATFKAIAKEYFANDSALTAKAPIAIFGPPLTVNENFILGVPVTLYGEFLRRAISSSMIVILLGSFIRLTYSLIKSQNEKRALENANLNAELTFLKSQINPHFLFNTLNSIYSEAHSKSANTEHSVLKLSDMLRYMLYDTRAEKIALEKDLQYISNYIDLQRLRILDKVTISYDIKGKADGLLIAPLLLITYIENAFKHGISYKAPSAIIIDIIIFDKTLTLHVSNPITKQANLEENGIGLKNTGRRLDLLYPDKYILTETNNADNYTVDLTLNLDDD